MTVAKRVKATGIATITTSAMFFMGNYAAASQLQTSAQVALASKAAASAVVVYINNKAPDIKKLPPQLKGCTGNCGMCAHPCSKRPKPVIKNNPLTGCHGCGSCLPDDPAV